MGEGRIPKGEGPIVADVEIAVVAVEVGKVGTIAVAVIDAGQEPQIWIHLKDIVGGTATRTAREVGDDHVGTAAAGDVGPVFDFWNAAIRISRLAKFELTHAFQGSAEDNLWDEFADE